MSLTHWLVVIVIALLLFGRGKISDMMGDLAKGIKSFKKGMSEEDTPPSAPVAPRLQNQPTMDPNPDAHLQPMQDDRPHS